MEVTNKQCRQIFSNSQAVLKALEKNLSFHQVVLNLINLSQKEAISLSKGMLQRKG